MSDNNPNHHPILDRTPRRRSPWPLAIVALIFIVVPFLYWYGTWFGRQLTDQEIEKYLTEGEKPRHTQHALSQIAEQISKGDERAKRWYPLIIKQSSNALPEIRSLAAWTMGQDNRAEEFHRALLSLVEDDDPLVRENAALALVRFGDQRARTVLRSMLEPFNVAAPHSGHLQNPIPQGVTIKRNGILGRIRTGESQIVEVRSMLPGKMIRAEKKDGDFVEGGVMLFRLSPDQATAWEALRGLYLIGEKEDIAVIESFLVGDNHPERIVRQARTTIGAIEKRTEPSAPHTSTP